MNDSNGVNLEYLSRYIFALTRGLCRPRGVGGFTSRRVEVEWMRLGDGVGRA